MIDLLIALLAQSRSTLTVTPAGVGGVLQVRVTNAAGDYFVLLSDPTDATRRSQEVTPAWGVYFTFTADQAGPWTVSLQSFRPDPPRATIQFTLAPGGSRDLGDDGGSCGLTGLELLLLLLGRRRAIARC